MSTDTRPYRGAELVEDGIARYQAQHGMNRVYPLNGVPATREPNYTEEEKKLLALPLIKLARRDSKKHTAQ